MTNQVSNEFCKHPEYHRYEANKHGIVRHIVNKKDIGFIGNIGYIRIDLRQKGTRKCYLKHRFIFECFHGKINDATLLVDHINNIKTDNRLENLQLLTHAENVRKDPNKIGNLPTIPVRATNIKTGESFDFNSVKECAIKLNIIPTSIYRILNGDANSATSKKDKNIYIFEKLNYKTEPPKPPIRVRAININTNSTSDYISIADCGRSLNINSTSIVNILKGRQKTAKSKKDKCKYTFEKI